MIIPFVTNNAPIEFYALLNGLNCNVQVTGNIKRGATLIVFSPNGFVLATAPVVKSPDWYNNKIVQLGNDFIVLRASTQCFEINGIPTKQRNLSKFITRGSVILPQIIDLSSNQSIINIDSELTILDI